MFENPRRGRQERNFTTNNPKILDLKSSSEQIFSRKLPLGAPVLSGHCLLEWQLVLKLGSATSSPGSFPTPPLREDPGNEVVVDADP